jgi:DNA repair protein RadC
MDEHRGHRERVRNRFIECGLDSFEPHQIIEMILFYSIPIKDTNEIAHMLLDKYGSISGIFEADINDLIENGNINKNTAVLLNLIPALSRKYFTDKTKEKIKLNSSEKAGNYMISLFSGRVYEVFYCICLDSQNRINYSALLNQGTINEAPVYPRIVVETALRHKADSIILAHNHPGGSLRASNSDIETTKRIKNAVESIGIKVRDHIIVAGDKYLSFADEGIVI